MRPFTAGLLTAVLLAPAPAFAALSPQYQRLVELRRILEDTRISDAFDARHPVEKVEWIAANRYRVSAAGCAMDVAIRTVERHGADRRIGERPFLVVPGKLVCK